MCQRSCNLPGMLKSEMTQLWWSTASAKNSLFLGSWDMVFLWGHFQHLHVEILQGKKLCWDRWLLLRLTDFSFLQAMEGWFLRDRYGWIMICFKKTSPESRSLAFGKMFRGASNREAQMLWQEYESLAKSIHPQPSTAISKLTRLGWIGKRMENNCWLLITIQGTNISPKNGMLKMIFLFPRWDMLIPWRVFDFWGGTKGKAICYRCYLSLQEWYSIWFSTLQFWFFQLKWLAEKHPTQVNEALWPRSIDSFFCIPKWWYITYKNQNVDG